MRNKNNFNLTFVLSVNIIVSIDAIEEKIREFKMQIKRTLFKSIMNIF